jgi:hypothetical protein
MSAGTVRVGGSKGEESALSFPRNGELQPVERLAGGRGHIQAERLDGQFVGDGLTCSLYHDSEAAAIVPHRPADVVLFERGSDIGDPRGAALRIRGLPINAELVARQRHTPMFAPRNDFVELRVYASAVPAIMAITNHLNAVDSVGNEVCGRSDIFRRRRIRKVAKVMLKVGRPGRALVSEDVRVVEMKIVNDVRVVNGLHKKQLAISRPIRTRNNDGMGRRPLTNGVGEPRLHAFPAIPISKFRFVQYFKKHRVGVGIDVVSRERAPEILELLDERIIGDQFLLEVAVGVHVENYGETLIENHFDGCVEISQVISGNSIRLVASKHRLRINAQPHVIETYGFDQRDVLRTVPGLEVFLRVALRVIDLRKPFAKINAVTQMGDPAISNGSILGE